jgi:hypothetical protein
MSSAGRIDLDEAIVMLACTPGVLRAMLADLPERLVYGTEGGESWSPYDVVGHLIHGEKTDWVPRLRIILTEGETRPFEPFDRFAQFEEPREESLDELLDEFTRLRAGNVAVLRELAAAGIDQGRAGTHPELGRVTAGELLSTWVVHDQGHVAQIARTVARQYTDQVGPWRAYLPVLERG